MDRLAVDGPADSPRVINLCRMTAEDVASLVSEMEVTVVDLRGRRKREWRVLYKANHLLDACYIRDSIAWQPRVRLRRTVTRA